MLGRFMYTETKGVLEFPFDHILVNEYNCHEDIWHQGLCFHISLTSNKHAFVGTKRLIRIVAFPIFKRIASA